VAQLTWTNESATAVGLFVQESTNDSIWTPIYYEIPASDSTYDVSGSFVSTQTYYFRIDAEGEYGAYSQYTDAGATNNLGNSTPPTPAPEAPSGLTANAVDDNQIDLNWVNNSTIQTGFDIQRSDVGSSGPWTDLGTVDANTFRYTDLDPALTPDTTYYYQVAALNGTAESAFCTSVGATTLPPAPTDVTAVADSSGDNINVTWSDSVPSYAYYQVEESTDGVSWNFVNAYPRTTSLSVPGQVNFDGTYYFRVQAIVSFNYSLYSDPVLADMSALAPTGGLSSGDGSSSGSGSGGPTGWSYVEVDAVSVPSDGNEVESHISLNSGGQYEIVASGYCTIGNGALGYTDASWTGFGKMPIDLSQTSPSGLQYGVFINGSDPGWGAYQSSHVYTINYTGSGGQLSFYFSDDYYPDNSGSIGVTILAWEPNQNNNNNNNAPQYPLAGMQVGDLAHAANSVYTDGSTTPTLYVPEGADGSVNLILTGQFYVGTTWSITGSNASPASGTFSSISQEVTLTPTGGNDDFTVTASEDGMSESANVVVQPWEIDATTLPSTPTATPPLLAQNQKLSPGALVQVDDGDFDNDGHPDDQEPNGAPPPSGDPSLMEAVLNSTGDSGSGDYYTVSNVYDYLKIWYQPSGGGAYMPVTASTKFPSENNTTIYIEGTRDGNDTVDVAWTTNGVTYFNADRFNATVYPGLIRTDANRDGTITFTPSTPVLSDRTSTSKPYRFWINDSDSVTNALSAQSDTVPDQQSVLYGQPGFNGADSLLSTIPDTLDLENWFPVVLQMPPGYNDNTWTTDFTMVGTDAPAIKAMFVTQTQEQQYLTNESVAQQLVGRNILFGLGGGGANNAPNIGGDWSSGFIPDGHGRVYMLVEGVLVGTGALTVTFLRSGVAVAQDSVNLDLQTITSFYEDWTVGDNNPTGSPRDPSFPAIPTTATLTSDSGPVSDRSGYSSDYVLFIPGYNMTPLDRREFADEAYKRLYWQGFKGRFGMFNWPTELFSVAQLASFDDSEYIAFESAPALLNLIESLDQAHYSVNLLAQSLGNIVASEALREYAVEGVHTQILNTYIATQAAVPANAYDGTVWSGSFAATYPNLALLQASTPDVYDDVGYGSGETSYSAPYFGTINTVVGKIYNFYNPQDGAVAYWEIWPADQATKPDTDVPSADGSKIYEYGYNSATGFYESVYINLGNGDTQFVEQTPLPLTSETDYWTVISFAAETFTTALGATEGVGGPFTADGEVNLQTLPVYPFGAQTYDHSGEFYHDEMQLAPYWNLVMQRFGLIASGRP
jgi:hypothetical protein